MSLTDILAKQAELKSETKTDDFSKVVFISDRNLSDNKACADNLIAHEMKVLEFDNTLFANRTFKDLNDKDVKFIWININDLQAKLWLKLNILALDVAKKDFKVVGIYSKTGGINQLWISQIKSDLVLEFDKLSVFNELNLNDLFGQMVATSIEICEPIAHRYLSCLFKDRVGKN